MSGVLLAKRALIIGASRGIGQQIALKMAAEGAHLAIAARGLEDLNHLKGEIVQRGGYAVALQCDCSLAEETTKVVTEAHKSLGGLDCLVNVAGTHPTWALIGDQSVESWNRTIAVNLSGVFYSCRAALPFLVAGRKGAIVNITSVAAFRAWNLVGPYCAAKAGVEMLTRTIAREYAPYGIRANCVAPGVIDAGITSNVFAADPTLREKMTEMHPVGRLGLAEEVADAIVWLLSDASSFTTGISLAVDGGFLA